MKTLAIANRKGGVGKTVTAHSIGAGLVKNGYRVLYIDLDSQGNLTDNMGAVRNAQRSVSDVLGRKRGRSRTGEAVQHTSQGDIIGADDMLSVADLTLTADGKEYRLKNALAEIASDYDFTIIDTPPALGVLATNALAASDYVIIPAQAEAHSVEGIKLLSETVEAVRKYCNPGIRIEGILMTRYNKRARISRAMLYEITNFAERIKTKVFKSKIRECTAIKEAEMTRCDIFRYDPRGHGAADYAAAVKEFLDDYRAGLVTESEGAAR